MMFTKDKKQVDSPMAIATESLKWKQPLDSMTE